MKMEEWKECKLGEYLYIKGRIGWKGLKKDEYLKESPYRIINGESLTEKGIEWSKAGFITKDRYDESPEIMLEINDILLSKDGTIGKIGFVKELLSPTTVASGIFVIRNINPEIIDTMFIYHFLRSSKFKNFIKMRTEGSVIPHLYQKDFEELDFPIPPLPTQQKIAVILSSLGDKIELNNKINTNLEQQAQALFKNWFVDKYEKQGTIGDYCAVKSGFAFKSAWWQDEGTKVIRIGDIEQGCLNLETCAHVATDKIEVAKDFIVQGGDLVIAMTGATIGKFSMIPKTQEPILVNQRVGKFFLGNNPLEKVPFIYCTLKQEEVITEFINRGQGSAQPNISTGDILSIPCWIPSKNEIDNFNKTSQPMFETIISNQEENRKLSDLRDSLLPKLMNGEIETEKLF